MVLLDKSSWLLCNEVVWLVGLVTRLFVLEQQCSPVVPGSAMILNPHKKDIYKKLPILVTTIFLELHLKLFKATKYDREIKLLS